MHNANWFWRIIDAVAMADPTSQLDSLNEHMYKMSEDELLDFIRHFNAAHSSLFHYNVWAIHLMALDWAGGDEVFEIFRAWLVLQGRDVCESIASSPSLIVPLHQAWGVQIADGPFYDAMYSCYEERFGEPPSETSPPNYASKMQGNPLTEHDLPRLFPQIWEYFEQNRSNSIPEHLQNIDLAEESPAPRPTPRTPAENGSGANSGEEDLFPSF